MKFIKKKTAGLVKPRTIVLVGILAAPMVVYSVAGSIAVWKIGWLPWLWWLAPICWIIAWMIGEVWPARPSDELQSEEIAHWTPRDQQAVDIVRRYQLEATSFNTEQLTDLQFYFNQAQMIAHDLARHYRPHTPDPIAERTLPEILAACCLVADDLEELLLTSIPGSRMLTVKQWRKLSETPKFLRQATKAFWASRILLNPFNLAQWGTSKVTNDKVTSDLQTELMVTLYIRFVRQLGYYLIEMNSGRLRGGSHAYRRAFNQFRNHERMLQRQIVEVEKTAALSDRKNDSPAVNGEKLANFNVAKQDVDSPSELEIRIAVLGQRGSGKTTLIHALVEKDSQRQKSDRQSGEANQVGEKEKINLPARKALPTLKPTRSFQNHAWDTNPCGAHFVLLDTPGYEPHSTGRKLKKIVQYAVDNAHAILLTLDSRAQSWEVDKELLERIQRSFQEKANLKPARTIGAIVYRKSEVPSLASADSAASVAQETSAALAEQHPPSEDPQAVLDRARTFFEGWIDEFVVLPVNALEESHSVFKDRLISALIRHRDAARSNAILTAYEDSLNRDKYRILYRQTKSSVKNLLSNWLRRDHGG